MNDLSGIPTAFRRLILKSGLTQELLTRVPQAGPVHKIPSIISAVVVVWGGGGRNEGMCRLTFQILTLNSISEQYL